MFLEFFCLLEDQRLRQVNMEGVIKIYFCAWRLYGDEHIACHLHIFGKGVSVSNLLLCCFIHLSE